MTTQAELAAGLTSITNQISKVQAESSATLDRVTELESAIANSGGVAPEVETAFAALKAQVQTLDDLIPDAADVPVPDVNTGTVG